MTSVVYATISASPPSVGSEWASQGTGLGNGARERVASLRRPAVDGPQPHPGGVQ
jgi:hypothetical protein